MKKWNRKYRTKRERLLNVMRQFQYEQIKPETGIITVGKIVTTIDKLNKRICK
jgi:hypothetical protein